MSKFDDLYNNYIINFGGGAFGWLISVCAVLEVSWSIVAMKFTTKMCTPLLNLFNMCLLIEVFGKYGL